MKGRILSLAIILMVIGSFGAVATNFVNYSDVDETVEYKPGEVIVGFYKELDDLDPIDVELIDSFEGHSLANKIEILNAAVIQVAAGNELAFIDSIIESPYVEYAEPNYVVHATYLPNDPRWDAQWGPQRIHCAEAWEYEQGSSSVVVAIVDTGVDYDHEDISGNYVSGGYDFVNGDSDPMDDNDHGTHCAGIAAAVMDNNKGIAGVAQVSIMAEKVLSAGGSGYSSDVADGITHAADNGADIISMSLGSSTSSSVIENACDYAYNDKDVIIVAASGNDYDDEVGYPAAHDTVIAVGAIDQHDQRCGFSNYGEEMELVAPGLRIVSSIPGNDYDYFGGTSMATPHVAGVAALARSQHPSWTNVQVREELKNTAEDLGPTGWDEEYGYGLVDARLSGEVPDDGAYVNIMIKEVRGQDDIDLGSEAEWYYKIKVNDQSRFGYDGYDELVWNLFWVFHWNERDLWQIDPPKTYSFFTGDPTVDIKIKLMDDDIIGQDIADISERESDDFWGGEEGRIFTIEYNLETNAIIGDRYEGTDWLYTMGEWDGSTDPENPITSPKQDDAKLTFKITDDYDPADYDPDLYVDPTSFFFGTVSGGTVVEETLTIKNNAKKNDPFHNPQNLNWNIDKNYWISLSQTSGSLEPGEQIVLDLEIDTHGMQAGTYEGFLQVNSNGGTKNVEVIIDVPRARTYQPAFYNLAELFRDRFPVLFNLLERLQMI